MLKPLGKPLLENTWSERMAPEITYCLQGKKHSCNGETWQNFLNQVTELTITSHRTNSVPSAVMQWEAHNTACIIFLPKYLVCFKWCWSNQINPNGGTFYIKDKTAPPIKTMWENCSALKEVQRHTTKKMYEAWMAWRVKTPMKGQSGNSWRNLIVESVLDIIVSVLHFLGVVVILWLFRRMSFCLGDSLLKSFTAKGHLTSRWFRKKMHIYLKRVRINMENINNG